MERIGKYQIAGVLGAGGFATVYKAIDPSVGRVVAIKVLKFPDDVSMVKRFQVEARTAANLRHRNIVTIFEFGEENGMQFLVMEYLDGTTLRDLIAQKAPLSTVEKLAMMSEVAQGLQAAHEHGVLHRDVKPGNIMRLPDGSVKIMDFGISRPIADTDTRLTQAGFLLGTPEYMAPEQFTGDDTDGVLIDIWGYGVVLYEFLTGVHPFQGAKPAQVMYRVTAEEPRPLSGYLPDVPERLEAVVTRLLSKNRELRYQTIEDARLDLEPVLLEMRRALVPALIANAEEQMREQSLDAALGTVRRVLELDPSNAQARQRSNELREMLQAKAMQGRIQELTRSAEAEAAARNYAAAAERLETALRLDPASEDLRKRLEEIQAHRERTERAASLLSSARTEMERSGLTAAMQQVSQALEIDPQSDDAKRLLAAMEQEIRQRELDASRKQAIENSKRLTLLARFDEALAVLKEFEARAPGDQAIQELLEQARRQTAGQQKQQGIAEAVAACRELLQRGNYQQAIETLQPRLQEMPGDPQLAALLSFATEQARDAQVRDILASGERCAQAGEIEKALDFAGQALELAPENPQAQQLRQSMMTARDRRAEEHAARPDHTVIAPLPELISKGFAAVEEVVRQTGTEAPSVTTLFRVGKLPRVHLDFNSATDPLLASNIPIAAVPFQIGRSAANAALQADQTISSTHAVLDWRDGSFTITDLNSRNGTCVNGRRLQPGRPEPLPFGAVIRLSHTTELTFVSDEISTIPDFTDQIIGGTYRLRKMIRPSGKGALYEATHTRLPQTVAVKLLSPDLARYPGYLEQFTREAETAARLQHPHICSVLDHGCAELKGENGAPVSVNYFCMEMMEGGSLADRLDLEERPTVADLMRWLDPVTDALEYAHKEGVIHAGLKPTSIVFDALGRPYITEFALASRAGEKGRRELLGATDFLAPEQLDGDDPLHQSDQYSLAVLVYLVLTGSRPYEGQRDPVRRKRNFARGPSPLHEEAAHAGRPDVPADASVVVRRALSLLPADRYESIREFFFAFQYAITNPGGRRPGDPRVFVSYHRKSTPGWPVLFKREWKDKHGISAFIDTDQIDAAEQVTAKVANAIGDSDAFVCFLGPKTLNSKWVQSEIKIAWEKGKPMVPVFQQSFRWPVERERLPEHVQALLQNEGAHLMDLLNIHVDHTIADVAKIVHYEFNRRSRKAGAP